MAETVMWEIPETLTDRHTQLPSCHRVAGGLTERVHGVAQRTSLRQFQSPAGQRVQTLSQ